MAKKTIYECPLCHSKLPEARYLEVLGLWQEQERFKASLRVQLAAVAKAKEAAKALKGKLESKHRVQLEIIRKKFERAAERRIEKLSRSMDARLHAAEHRERAAATDRAKLLANLDQLRRESKDAEKRGEKRAERNAKGLIKQLEKRIAMSEASSRRAEKDKATLKRDFTRRIRGVERAATERGREEIKKANERVLRTVKAKDIQIAKLNSQNKELHDQIRKGVTQQTEGIHFERTLAEELRRRFRADLIEPFGKGGDILHTVRDCNKPIGAILYECKKTEKWSNSFLKQVKRDMVARKADYGVVVTFALPKTARGFLVRSGITFVHPYGALYLADTLRTSLIEVHQAKISPGKIERRLKDLMVYIQGNRFKGAMRQVIGETEELVQAMGNEMKEHKRFWTERYSRYSSIFTAASKVRAETIAVLKDGNAEHVEGPVIAGFLPMPSLAQER